MAAGLGTRLRPLTDEMSKCLVPVAGRPLLDYWQASFLHHGIGEVLINVHAHPQQVRDWVAQRNAEGPVSWNIAEEPELFGSAGTLRANLKRMEEAPDFIVLYADNLSEVDLGELVRIHRARDAHFTMGLFETPYPSACGIATLEDDGIISAFEEKPKHPASNLANAGIYMIRSGSLDGVLRATDFDIGHDILPRLVERMHGWPTQGYHRDVGTPEALAEIEADLAAGRAPTLTRAASQSSGTEEVPAI
jgi:mannose-1-phosphate guanylyltransferase